MEFKLEININLYLIAHNAPSFCSDIKEPTNQSLTMESNSSTLKLFANGISDDV